MTMVNKNILCQGVRCPNRSECLHNARYLAAPAEDRHRAIAHCLSQKRFERISLDHPQHARIGK